jgi:hypothetical protein
MSHRCRTEISLFESIFMATIKTRQRKDGSLAYLTEVRVKRGAGPSTANNDIIWLRAILRYARAAWDLPFDLSVIDNANEGL